MKRGELSVSPNGGPISRVWQRGDLVDLLHDVVSAHAPDATYLFASAASTNILGYTPEELIGTSPYDYFHPEDIEETQAAHGSALRSEPYTVTYRVRHKAGHYLWVETTGQTLKGPSGEVAEILCSTRPIVDRPGRDAGDVHDLRLQRIERALADETLDVHLQPIVDLQAETVCAYEALSRFHGEGAPTPDVWFADAWSVGRGIDLELLAVEKAVQLLPEIPAKIGLTVNVSPPTIGSPRFLTLIDGVEKRIRVELTEHLRVSDYGPLREDLAPFRDRGGQVAVDDFGAGYASLSHIINVRPDWVKLDIALVESIETDPVVQAVARGTVRFADHAGIGLVAEGIERRSQLDMLMDFGIKYGQGFLLGRPLPPDEALATR